MKVLLKSLLIAGLVAGFVSCNDDNPWANQQGSGKISLKLSASSDLVESSGPLTTRSIETLDTPEVNDFSVSLNKNDESYSKTWNSLSEFADEESFPTGVYTITAFYGDAAGEGFDKPYYEGTADVTVLEARTTEVSVEASLANCLVSIGYTDAFKNYFKSWKATVHSEGNGFHEIKQGETRPVYIIPGETGITLELTSQDGKTTSVQPTEFSAEAKHRYHLVFDVNNGNLGNAQLSVIFDDTIEQETVNIDLTDELFSTPPPSVTPSGFVSGVSQEALEGSAIDRNFVFNVVSRGKIRSANLTVNSTYIPSFGNEVDLCQTSSAALSDAGIDAKGFVNNPDRLAFVNVSDFVAGLPAGHHEITLVVKDAYTRVSDPVTLVVDNVPTTMNVNVVPTNYGTNDAVLEISYNGTNPQKYITFTTPDDFGSWQPVKVKSVTEASRSRAFESKNYIFTLEVRDTDRDFIPVKVFLRGVEKEEVNIPVIMPKYSFETDAFANKIGIKINPENSDLTSAITGAVRVLISGSGAEGVSMTRDKTNGIVWLRGLKPATDYTIETTMSRSDDAIKTTPVKVTTEAAAQLPNNDFTETTRTINLSDIQVGGQYQVWPASYTLKSSIERSMPVGWSSLNDYTCWSGSSNKNTWFLVPSTYDENGEVVIRSVGFSHNGTTPGRTGGAGSTTYYCTNSASFSDSEKCAGELFLGSYSYDGSAHRVDGISFTSRPASMTFRYKYAPLNNEKGLALIEVLDASGNVIARNSVEISASEEVDTEQIKLPDYKFGQKADKIRVSFKSSTASVPAIYIPTGGELNEHQTLGNHTMSANSYHAFAIGSVLTISNVTLTY